VSQHATQLIQKDKGMQCLTPSKLSLSQTGSEQEKDKDPPSQHSLSITQNEYGDYLIQTEEEELRLSAESLELIESATKRNKLILCTGFKIPPSPQCYYSLDTSEQDPLWGNLIAEKEFPRLVDRKLQGAGLCFFFLDNNQTLWVLLHSSSKTKKCYVNPLTTCKRNEPSLTTARRIFEEQTGLSLPLSGNSDFYQVDEMESRKHWAGLAFKVCKPIYLYLHKQEKEDALFSEWCEKHIPLSTEKEFQIRDSTFRFVNVKKLLAEKASFPLFIHSRHVKTIDLSYKLFLSFDHTGEKIAL